MATPRAPPASGSRRLPSSNVEPEPEGVIGDFLRGKEIGKGSFATVYLAQHRVCFPERTHVLFSHGYELVESKFELKHESRVSRLAACGPTR